MPMPRSLVRKGVRRLFQKPYAWFCLGLFVIGWTVWINLFPEGTVVLGGDVLQPMNLHENWLSFHYEWLGRVSLFYGVFYLLDTFGVSETGQLSWYLGIFLFGAYASFFAFTRLVFPKVSGMTGMLASLFYATNIYTLYVFTATWGFTHYQILYVFIPLLVGLFLRAISERDSWRFPLLFLFALAIASTSFGNPAFALGTGVFFLLLTGGVYVTKIAPFDRESLKKLMFMAFGGLLLNAYWLLPLLPQVRSGVSEVESSSDIVLSDSLRKTSNAFFDTVRLLQTHEANLYYPQNFPYVSINWLEGWISLLAFAPFVLVLMSWSRHRGIEDKRLKIFFLGLFACMAALVAHVRFPFDGINTVLFQLPGLNVLRGWDKLAIFTPFLMAALLVPVLVSWQDTRYARLAGAGFFMMTVLLALPFYLGGIQTKMSYILAGNSKKDYRTADYRSLVTIPKPYYDIESVFARDAAENKISRLPFSPGSSVGRVNLPEWGVNGLSPENALYSKKYVEPNNAYFSDWMPGEDFDDSRYDPRWILDWYGLIGVKYIVWHKDARQDSIDALDRSRAYLRDRGDIVPVTDNAWFTLYRINDAYVFPYAYAVSGGREVYPALSGFSEKVRASKEKTISLSYERKNPKEILIHGDSVAKGSDIVLNERYDSLWKADAVSSDGHRTALPRDESVRYANAWSTAGLRKDESIDVYYGPIRLLRIGTIVSSGAFGALVLAWGVHLVSRRRKSNPSI